MLTIKPIELMDADQIAIHVRCGDITMEQAKAVHHPNRIRAAERRMAYADQVEKDQAEAPSMSIQEMLNAVMR